MFIQNIRVGYRTFTTLGVLGNWQWHYDAFTKRAHYFLVDDASFRLGFFRHCIEAIGYCSFTTVQMWVLYI